MRSLSAYPELATLTIKRKGRSPTRPAFVEDERTGCFVYQGADNGRYGLITRRRRQTTIHRFVWELLFGPLVPGTQIHHRCGNRLCANPLHLEPLSHAEHCRRHNAGLIQPADYARIDALEAQGMLHHEIADLFGVSRSRITQVLNRTNRRAA